MIPQTEDASGGEAVQGDAAVDPAASQYLTFMLDGEEYGIEILRVQEIKGWEETTEIPNTPDYVLGVINLRGAVIPVMDMRRRFGMPPREFGKLTVVIVVHADVGDEGKTMGFVVDAVSDVHNIDPASIKPPPDVESSVDTRYIKGLATVDEQMIILLDLEHVVAEQ
ncbi:MAG: chemotaxis protein CheW [Pseudomonadota bacterium]